MAITITEGAVYFEKDGKRTLHTRQEQAAQSEGIAADANARNAAMGLSGQYVAVAEHFE